MKQIKFYDIPELVHSNFRLSFDGDKKDLRLHSEDCFNWGANTKKAYSAAEKAIDKINYSGNGWKIYGWYDVSGYEYWMKKQQEQNYIQISIIFDNEEIAESELPLLIKALDSALADADAIEFKNPYHPSVII